jgi:plasmid segregation protein ParM
MMAMHFYVGNDNGNSEHDLMIDGRLIASPNVNVGVEVLPWSDEQTAESFIPALQEQLVVTIDSPSARPGMYYIGKFALDSGEIVDSLQIGIDRKSETDIPLINTLAHIAAVAVQKAYEEEKQVPLSLEVQVDMATALPVTEHSDERAAAFERRFMSGIHHVTVHLGTHRTSVKLDFPYTKVVPEATTAIFTLQKDQEGNWREGEIFADFAAAYGLDKKKGTKFNGAYFKDKRILHADIGDGSTEYPITEGNKFLRQFVLGSHHGIGYAIEESLQEFNQQIHLPDSPRQFFSDVIKNPKHKYHGRALRVLKRPLETQAKQIILNIKRQLTKARNEIDLICVYGGGSILLRNILQPMLIELCAERELQLFYVPEDYAVQLNALGLDAFVRGKIFAALKAKSQVQPV